MTHSRCFYTPLPQIHQTLTIPKGGQDREALLQENVLLPAAVV